MAEYRAVAQGELVYEPEASDWGTLRDAEVAAKGFLDALSLPFDEVWIERRVVVEQPPPERIRTLRKRSSAGATDVGGGVVLRAAGSGFAVDVDGERRVYVTRTQLAYFLRSAGLTSVSE